MNNINEAKVLLATLEEEVPSSPLSLCAGATVNLAENNMKEAEEKLNKARKQEAKYYIIQYLSGKIAEKKGNLSQALKYYKQTLKYKPFWEEAKKRLKNFRFNVYETSNLKLHILVL
jgi:predicted Zn-dependent protease